MILLCKLTALFSKTDISKKKLEQSIIASNKFLENLKSKYNEIQTKNKELESKLKENTSEIMNLKENLGQKQSQITILDDQFRILNSIHNTYQ